MNMSAERKNAHNRTERKLIMMTMNTRLAALAFGIAVAAVASPAVAQRNNNEVSAARAEALRECSARQQKDLEYFGACNRTIFTGPVWLSTASRSDVLLRRARGPVAIDPETRARIRPDWL
jgi:hypothetical protein